MPEEGTFRCECRHLWQGSQFCSDDSCGHNIYPDRTLSKICGENGGCYDDNDDFYCHCDPKEMNLEQGSEQAQTVAEFDFKKWVTVRLAVC